MSINSKAQLIEEVTRLRAGYSREEVSGDTKRVRECAHGGYRACALILNIIERPRFGEDRE